MAQLTSQASFQVVRDAKNLFEEKKHIYESALIKFNGVGDLDVYNCSVPFKLNGKDVIYGRIEKREEWANSHVRLFEKVGKDEYTVIEGGMTWFLEDPYISKIQGEAIFGGTRIRKSRNRVFNYYCDFFRGDPTDNVYFTTGPDDMKDIRCVDLKDGRIGVFSRPKTATYAAIGFAVIDKITELTPKLVQEVEAIPVLHTGAWGGVNQAYLLSSGHIGCIAHYSYNARCGKRQQTNSVYINYSFVFDPETRQVFRERIIGTKACYPECPVKEARLVDCAFSAGIVMREDGKCDLYSGLGDTSFGRITIDYPFEGHGEIVGDLDF